MATQTALDVAGKVRGLAAEKRIRQTDLAASLGISRVAVARRFSGSVPFTTDELIQIADVMDVPVSRFFGERS